MNPEELKKLQNEFGDSKAGLSFSNMLREQLFMQENPPQDMGMGAEQPVEPSQEAEMAPTEATAPEPQNTPTEPETTQEDPIKGLEDRLTQRIDDLEKHLKDEQQNDMKKEMGEIKKTLKDLSA